MIYIEEVTLVKCEVCNKYHGTIKEKYNGIVPVHCKCDMKNKPLANPCCMCIGDEISGSFRVIWKPTTDNKDENGVWWHTPYFNGPSTW